MAELVAVDFDPFKKSTTPDDFSARYGAAAEKAGKALGVDPKFVLGQWGLETGWGKSVIPGTNNLGNIKDFSGGGTAATDNMTGSRDKYRAYASPDQFVDEYVSLIQRKYPDALNAKTSEEFAKALKSGGYAEDPGYVSKVKTAASMTPTRASAGGLTLVPVDHDPFAMTREPATSRAESGESFGSEVKRQLGLTFRAGVKGSMALPGTVSDAATGLVNAGLDAYHDARAPDLRELVTGKQKGFRFQTVNSALDNIMTGIGVPQPQDATERVVQDVAGAMAGAGSTVAAGRALQGAGGLVGERVGSLLAAGPGIQTVSGATSAGASGVTRESGGSPLAQGLAGVAGAVAPGAVSAGSAEFARRAIRGGEAGRQKVEDNIRLFRDATGTVPSVGQATEGRLNRAVESVLAKTPGSAGVISKSAQAKADAMADSVSKLADELAPAGSAINAGEAISRGVQGFKEGFRSTQKRLYDTLDQYISPDTPVDVSNTRAALAALNEGIPGAPNISEFFKNSKIKGIDAALVADLEKALAANSSAFSGLLGPSRGDLSQARLPYEAIKKLRTLVGNEIADNSLLADVPRSKWTALYAALSDDLGIAASRAGPEAEQSFRWANQFTKSQLARLEQLSGVVGKDAPEKVFSAAMSGTAEGNTTLKRVVDAIPKENRRELASAVLRRMGRATNSNQNEIGDVFSTESFLTNLNKLSPDSRATLFGRLGIPATENRLLELAKVAANVREGSKVFANPSGTQPAISAQATGLGGVLALASGNLPVASAALGTPVLANALAHRLTSPDAVKWLGRKTEFPAAPVAASELNALSRLLQSSKQAEQRPDN